MTTIATIVAGIVIITIVLILCVALAGVGLAVASRADELLGEWIETRRYRRKQARLRQPRKAKDEETNNHD